MNERTQFALKLILSHIILLPVLILISPFINQDSFLLLSVTQTILVIIFLSGYWEFFGLRFKITYCITMETLVLIVLLFKILSQTAGGKYWYLITILILLQTYLLIGLIKIFIVIFRRENVSVEIEFPFKDGKYLITDGGNSKLSRLMNYHYFSPIHKKNKTNRSMLFATDIVKLKNLQSNFLPEQNEDYPIFGEKVLSPIDGIVVKVVNNIDDNVPYCGNYPYNTGNTIVIHKDNYNLILGHLKKGSNMVEVGDSVNAGDIIAEAGNSGYSERPHIHMQLINSPTENFWQGPGISIQYKMKNLYKNRVINIKS